MSLPFHTAVLATAVSTAIGVAADPRPPELGSISLAGLGERLGRVDAELSSLASYSLRSGVGNVGHRSATHAEKDAMEWVRIDLERGSVFDQVVLVPALWRDTRNGFRADGFPSKLRIVAGLDGEDGRTIREFASSGLSFPRIAPVVIDVGETRADWIRIDALELTPRAWDGKYIFQLSEILVFDGSEDIALGRKVEASSEDASEELSRDKKYLVDGLVPYLMDAAEGSQSVAMLSKIAVRDQPAFTLDLGKSHLVNRVHLHQIDLSDTVPQTSADDLGLPRHLVIQGAENQDFSDAFVLSEFRTKSPYDIGPIIPLRFPGRECRYLRFVAEEPYINFLGEMSGSQIGFAEVEVFSAGVNVALGKPVTADFEMISPGRSLAAVTDGLNLYGKILPVRAWLGQLARRHDLEAERPLIVAELDSRHERQKALVTRMGWLAVILAAVLVVTILVQRMIRMRDIGILRERFAADLHDELGANLHTIGLLSDLAEECNGNPVELSNLHRRIRSETERSGTAVRHCTDMLSSKDLYGDFFGDMQRLSRRVMARLSHEISVSGEEHLQKLEPRTRAGLFLFYKECLVNISRHSGATEYRTKLVAGENRISLQISDNGKGLPDAGSESIPRSLDRRARLLGADVSASELPDGGTCITLELSTGFFARLFQRIRI